MAKVSIELCYCNTGSNLYFYVTEFYIVNNELIQGLLLTVIKISENEILLKTNGYLHAKGHMSLVRFSEIILNHPGGNTSLN